MFDGINNENLSKQYSLLQQEYQKLTYKHNKLKCKYDELTKEGSIDSEQDTFTSNLLRIVRSLYNNSKYSDLVFKLKGYKIPGHKFVMEANNVDFDLMDEEISFEDYERQITEQVIRWLYSQEININQNCENLWKMIKMCCQLNIWELKNRCGEALVSSVNHKNCIKFFMDSSEYNVDELKKYCGEFIKTNWSNYSPDNFKCLSGSVFLDLLEQKTTFALHEAVRFGRDDAVYLFLNRHFSELEHLVNEMDDQGDLVLDLALQSGRTELCETLLKNCADINIIHPTNSLSLLHLAINRCDDFSAQFLIKNECCLNALTPDTSRSPLQLLAMLKRSQLDPQKMQNMIDAAQLLIKSGADVNLSDSMDLTAVSLSVLARNSEILESILASGRCTCINGTITSNINTQQLLISNIPLSPYSDPSCKMTSSQSVKCNSQLHTKAPTSHCCESSQSVSSYKQKYKKIPVNHSRHESSHTQVNHSQIGRRGAIYNSVLPLWLAICMEYRTDLLSTYDAFIDYQAYHTETGDDIDLLLHHGSDMCYVIDGQSGNTILLEVIQQQLAPAALKLIDWLLSSKGDNKKDSGMKKRVLNMGNFCRETPLHKAVEMEMVDVVERLLLAGADSNVARRKMKSQEADLWLGRASIDKFSSGDSLSDVSERDGDRYAGNAMSEPMLDGRLSSEYEKTMNINKKEAVENLNPFQECMDSNTNNEHADSHCDDKQQKRYSGEKSIKSIVLEKFKPSTDILSISVPNIMKFKKKNKQHERTGSSESQKLFRKIAMTSVTSNNSRQCNNEYDVTRSCSARSSLPNRYHNLIKQGLRDNNANLLNNSQVIDCCTPAHLAILSHNEQLVRLFVEHDSNVNWTLQMDGKGGVSNDGETVFTLLLWSGFMDLVLVIYSKHISKGDTGHFVCPLDLMKDSQNVPLLHQAIYLDKLDAVKFIIEAGADIDIRSADNLTPLHRAIQLRKSHIVRVLTESGTDLNLTYTYYDTDSKELFENISGIWLALVMGEFELAQILVNAGCDIDLWLPDSNTGFSQTQLHRAIAEKLEDIAIFLIQNGCDCKSPRHLIDADHYNSQLSYSKTITVPDFTSSTNPFEESGSDSYMTDKEDAIGKSENYILGDTPLHMVCRLGLLSVARQLLSTLSPAYVCMANSENSTPLHIAIERSTGTANDKYTNQLISMVIDVVSGTRNLSAKDKRGHTAFHIAMARSNQIAAREILSHEPSASNEVDNLGRNYLHVAVENHNMEAVCFLISVNADLNVRVCDAMQYTPLQLGVIVGTDENILRSLILAGAKIDALTIDKKNLLHLAVLHRRINLLDCLIDNGCSLEQADNNLDTPFHLVMKIGDRDILEKILPKLSDCITTKNLRGESGLHILSKSGNEKAIVLFVMLLEHYPNFPIDDRDACGNTSLFLAALANNTKLAVAMVAKGACLGCVNNDNVTLFNSTEQIPNDLIVKLLETLDSEPVWADGEVCVSCLLKFSIKNRKHHCRHCGRLICGKCSENEIAIMKYNIKKPVRVCDICFDFLVNGSLYNSRHS